MSNLKLPVMTFEALSKNVKPGQTRKLAYATEAYRSHDGTRITITQHSNPIAILSEKSVFVDNCGYDTTTTSTRINKILSDNEIPYYVRIRQYQMRLFNASHTELDDTFRSLEFVNLGYGSSLNWVPNWATLADGAPEHIETQKEVDLFVA